MITVQFKPEDGSLCGGLGVIAILEVLGVFVRVVVEEVVVAAASCVVVVSTPCSVTNFGVVCLWTWGSSGGNPEP